MVIGTQYVHPGQLIDDMMVENLARASTNCPGILVGDFNVPLKLYGGKTNSTPGEVLRIITETHGLIHVKNKVMTRINNIRGKDNVLDVFFVNQQASEQLYR